MKRHLAFALLFVLLFTQFALAEEAPYIYDGVEVPLQAEGTNGQYQSFLDEESYVLFRAVDLEMEVTKLLMPSIMSMFMDALGATNYQAWEAASEEKLTANFPLAIASSVELEGALSYCCFFAKDTKVWIFIFRGDGAQSAEELQSFEQMSLDYLMQVKPVE